MTPKEFLRAHWQKKPLVIRRALPNFTDPIAPDELAGLACEEGVESRIVKGELAEKAKRGASTKRGAPWEVVWGPHPEARFRSLPDHGWTLLVQEVNRWVPEAALLLDHFSFLPSVRVDDVMVSFAAKGGSVGPHLDSYDVFLLQGEGKRRWRFDTKRTKNVRFVEGLDLRILESFVLDADVVLERGDILYLPPGFAHYGVSETRTCLTYSIGFRSPRKSEAWSSFAASRDDAGELLTDPPLAPLANPGAIPKSLLERVRAMVRSMDMSNDAIDRWFASYATRLKPGHTIEPPKKAPTEKTIFARLAKGDVLKRSEEGRWAYLEKRSALLLYVGGEEIEVKTKDAIALAKRLCALRRHSLSDLKNETRSRASRRLLVDLIERGALYF
jgi:50S ribosomal protein L16 3-hydroxylase